MADLVIVDDEDPRITYTGTWLKSGTSNEYAGTTKGTVEPGTQATFIFTGSFVAVYGTITDNSVPIPPISTYSIDGSDSVTFAPTPGPQILYRQQFYKSPQLQDGDHTLVITSIANDSRFWLDYIQYVPTSKPSPQPTTVIETSIATASNTPNTPAVTSPTSTADTNTQINTTDTPGEQQGNVTSSRGASTVHKDTPTETNNKSPTLLANPTDTTSSTSSPLLTSESSKVPAGAIVGGAIGGVATLLVFFLLLWYWRKAKNRRAQLEPTPTGPQTNFWSRPSSLPTVTPFSMGRASAQYASVSAPPPYTQTDKHIYLR